MDDYGTSINTGVSGKSVFDYPEGLALPVLDKGIV
jgi:hypothetical protein